MFRRNSLRGGGTLVFYGLKGPWEDGIRLINFVLGYITQTETVLLNGGRFSYFKKKLCNMDTRVTGHILGWTLCTNNLHTYVIKYFTIHTFNNI